MRTFKIILNVIGLVFGLFFIIGGASDIQLGFGSVLILMSLNNLL